MGSVPDKLESPVDLMSRMPPRGQTLVASSAGNGWDGIHCAVVEGRITESFDFSGPFPAILFFLKGTAQLEWRREKRFSRVGVKPGDMLISAPGDPRRIRTSLPLEMLWCALEPEWLDAISGTPGDSGGLAVQVVESFPRGDEELWHLGRRLAGQLGSTIPGSRMYAESLLTQIGLHIAWDYSTRPRSGEGRDDRPADQRVGKVVDYIRRTLTDDLSLDTLAGVAGLSPNYFLSAFKQATGQTPHQFVIEERVARACQLLRDPHRPITEVSLAVGFSSQSHLTEAFRRLMKTTPAAYRKEVLGMSKNGDGRSP